MAENDFRIHFRGILSPYLNDPVDDLIVQTTFLLLAAADCTTNWDDSIPKTRVTIVEVKNAVQRKSASPTDYLTKIGEWIVECAVENVGMVTDGSGTLLVMTSVAKCS